ncbi:MAG: hypothetical protein E7609_04025 [Ruminococcaceae bacterium]|nr:hypothetical protein [Oscillospiraceae bacterium]
MKLYDISQEVFSCRVYPGDPLPQKETLSSMEKGDLYNLTAFSMARIYRNPKKILIRRIS